MKTSVLLHTRHVVQPEPRLLLRVKRKQHPLNSKPLLPPLTPSLRQLSFYQYFLFLWMTTFGPSYKWNHTIFVFLWLTYFTQHMSSRFVHVIARVRMSSRLSNIPFMYLPYVVNPFIHSVGTCTASASWLLGIVLLWTWVCKYFIEILQILGDLCILLSRYPEVRVLSHAVILFLIFWGTFILCP